MGDIIKCKRAEHNFAAGKRYISSLFGLIFLFEKLRAMKRIIIGSVLLLMQLMFLDKINAQGWNQDKSGIYSVGVGGTQAIMLTNPYHYPVVYGAGFSVNVSGEYLVQRFIGVGFQTGMDVFAGPPYYPDEYPPYRAIGIPVIAKANVHILEAANAPCSHYLDLYAGLNFGGGPSFFTGPNAGVYGFLQGGPQVGIRFWPNSQLGIFGELGWGATFINFGLSF